MSMYMYIVLFYQCFVLLAIIEYHILECIDPQCPFKCSLIIFHQHIFWTGYDPSSFSHYTCIYREKMLCFGL